jgi:putative FmdB family regulatory protein
MPLYEYRCHRCGQTFELRQKFSETPLTVHEGCGGDVERIIFASALQFKGSGFYVNDYGRGGKSRPANGSNANAKSESKSDSKSESKPDSKGDSKPDSKSESKDKSKGDSKPESKGDSTSESNRQSQPSASTPSSEK